MMRKEFINTVAIAAGLDLLPADLIPDIIAKCAETEIPCRNPDFDPGKEWGAGLKVRSECTRATRAQIRRWLRDLAYLIVPPEYRRRIKYDVAAVKEEGEIIYCHSWKYTPSRGPAR